MSSLLTFGLPDSMPEEVRDFMGAWRLWDNAPTLTTTEPEPPATPEPPPEPEPEPDEEPEDRPASSSSSARRPTRKVAGHSG